MSSNCLKDNIVVVTGGSAGLGRATAVTFAKRGAHVAILARDRDRLHAAEAEIAQYGGRVLALSVDVADAEAMEEAADEIEEKLGPIDIWVNNAMTTVFAPVEQIEPAEFKRVTEVTYLGFVYGTMAALKRIRRRDRGVIVQVGSALAYRSIPLQSAYCGAKHAVHGFTDSLRCELIHGSRIHVTMVQMPALNTPQFDWVPEPHAASIAARASDLSAGGWRRGHRLGGDAQAPRAIRRLASVEDHHRQQTIPWSGRSHRRGRPGMDR